jgi:hypothetical protein
MAEILQRSAPFEFLMACAYEHKVPSRSKSKVTITSSVFLTRIQKDADSMSRSTGDMSKRGRV